MTRGAGEKKMAKAKRRSKSRGKGGKKGGAGGLLKYGALLAALGVGAYFFFRDEPDALADENKKKNGNGKDVTPKTWPPSNLPEGAGFANVTPYVRATDPAKWKNGLLVHVSPGMKTPLIAPEGVGTVHADAGTQIAILKLGIAVEGEGDRRWAHVWTKGGGKGYVSQIDPRDGGHSNIDVTTPITKEIGEDVGGDIPMGDPIYAVDEFPVEGAALGNGAGVGRVLPGRGQSLVAQIRAQNRRRWTPGIRGY